jgi:hypothetical protein
LLQICLTFDSSFSVPLCRMQTVSKIAQRLKLFCIRPSNLTPDFLRLHTI